MSHKIVFALCVSAALVACVASQSFKPSSCAQGAQSSAGKFSSNMQSIFTNLMTQVQNSGTNAINIEAFQQDLQSMMQQMSSLTNIENVDVQNMMSTYYSIVQTQMKMMTYFMNPQIGLTLFSAYMSSMGQIMSSNQEFVNGLASNCMPSQSG